MYRPFSGDWHILSDAEAEGMSAFFPYVSSGTSSASGLGSGIFVPVLLLGFF
jgi:hypothetical protein